MDLASDELWQKSGDATRHDTTRRWEALLEVIGAMARRTSALGTLALHHLLGQFPEPEPGFCMDDI